MVKPDILFKSMGTCTPARTGPPPPAYIAELDELINVATRQILRRSAIIVDDRCPPPMRPSA
ncbi:hypothetical protein CH295_26320 [Rhodococcus sp. 14-2483-1-2]|nr:hypothetical protein CH295_26320 [Rhodococcus sp. 14-2483-1-2]